MALPARRRADPDGWLFLTPEVEREVPSLVDGFTRGLPTPRRSGSSG